MKIFVAWLPLTALGKVHVEVPDDATSEEVRAAMLERGELTNPLHVVNLDIDWDRVGVDFSFSRQWED